MFATWGGSRDLTAPTAPRPSPEHYNRLVRLLQHGITPEVTLDIKIHTYTDHPMGFNVVGEIPGTTKKDEVIILEGHAGAAIEAWLVYNTATSRHASAHSHPFTHNKITLQKFGAAYRSKL